ncbi:baseplate J/gp47 family protein [Nonomuraea spiralis]|uniref:Baseplate J/gp47 family protein n=1 Tax=Nonomuraea spiralis TaxID=46182 RepID=A0ABV5IQ67_9ACTN|nr:baseplate J/gp47 family protein [Nonomuraea spiralis]GGT11684.1 hypothetical protein GCM10010176_065490 [Nonomuraea spiralis]
MATIRQVGGRPAVDYLARDYESLLLSMRALVPDRLQQWKDFADEADLGNVLLELFAHMGDILSYYQDRVANESFLSTARTRRSVIDHLRLIGYELGTGAPAAAVLSVSVPGTVEDTVTLSRGDAFATRSRGDRPSLRFEYTRQAPLTIDFGAIRPDRHTLRKVFVGVPVEEGRLISEEHLGTSDGTANQLFPLAHPRLIRRPQAAGDLLIQTRLGGSTEQWTARDTLAFSQADQHDYVVEIDAEDRATVLFGDGLLGRVPPAGAAVLATYRVGGGLVGNVAVGEIDTIVAAPQLDGLGAKISNPEPAGGGAEREDIEHAVRHAPAVFRSLGRAVTVGDYKALALRFKGVAKVRAVPTGWNRVTLCVAPEGGGKVSDVLEEGLLGYLEDKRMINQIVEVVDVDYVPIYVSAKIGVESSYADAEVLERVRRAAADLLAFEHVDFAQPLYLSRFYEEIQNTAGVLYVSIAEFRRGDPRAPGGKATDTIESFGKIELGPNEIPVIPSDPAYATGINVETAERERP